MTSPPLRLLDGESIVFSQQLIRHKGILGSRFGTLHITNMRLAFVKAIMTVGGMGTKAKKSGVKAMVTIPLNTIEKVVCEQAKKRQALLVYFGERRSERFVIESEALTGLLQAIEAQRSQVNGSWDKPSSHDA